MTNNERITKVTALTAVFVSFAAAAVPQLAAPNEMGVSMGVVQLAAPWSISASR